MNDYIINKKLELYYYFFIKEKYHSSFYIRLEKSVIIGKT